MIHTLDISIAKVCRILMCIGTEVSLSRIYSQVDHLLLQITSNFLLKSSAMTYLHKGKSFS